MRLIRIRGYLTLFKKLIWVSRKGLYTTTRLIYGVHFLDRSAFSTPQTINEYPATLAIKGFSEGELSPYFDDDILIDD